MPEASPTAPRPVRETLEVLKDIGILCSECTHDSILLERVVMFRSFLFAIGLVSSSALGQGGGVGDDGSGSIPGVDGNISAVTDHPFPPPDSWGNLDYTLGPYGSPWHVLAVVGDEPMFPAHAWAYFDYAVGFTAPQAIYDFSFSVSCECPPFFFGGLNEAVSVPGCAPNKNNPQPFTVHAARPTFVTLHGPVEATDQFGNLTQTTGGAGQYNSKADIYVHVWDPVFEMNWPHRLEQKVQTRFK